MKQWEMWQCCKNKCILPFFSKKLSQKVILCTIFHKFDLLFLFDFNITKMHIFCNFFKSRLLLSQTKNDFYWQPILTKLIHLRFWSDGAGFKTEAQKCFDARTMHKKASGRWSR